jgi:hypothetical protein
MHGFILFSLSLSLISLSHLSHFTLFLQKNAAMSLVDQLNDEEDRTREQKLQKESEKVHFLKEKEQKKKVQKQKKEELRKMALKEIEEKQKTENAPAKVISFFLSCLFETD